jgi:tetratricopeptide (TPR) repeat protein
MNHERRPPNRGLGETEPIEPPRRGAADLLAVGLNHHQAGRLVEAEGLYLEILAVCPNHPDALHLLGVIACQTDRPELALQLFELAIRLDPRNSLYHSNRGLALRQVNRLEDAIESYDCALALRPDYTEALFNRGVTLQKLKRLDEALESYDRTLATRPDHVEALSNRGVLLQELQRFDEALACYDRALAECPRFVEALSNRGNVLKELKRFQEALESYDQALAMRPNDAEVLYNRGNTLKELKRLEDALESFDRALALRPNCAAALCNRGAALAELRRFDDALLSYDAALAVHSGFAEAWSNRGNTLKALGRFEEALESYDRALAVRPNRVEVLYNRAVVLHDLQRFDDALENYDRVLAVRPDYPEALSNRGSTLQELQRFGEALDSYDRALAARPDYAEAGCNRALLLLLNGSFPEGWLGYEWRRKLPTWVGRSFEPHEWSGVDVSGKRLLLYAEQGFGDTIQFARYAPLVAARGARVVLEVQRPLKYLLKGVSGVEMVVAKDEMLPSADLQCSLLSLPLMFATTVETIPSNVPYIHPRADRVEAWKRRLPRDAAMIGLVWSGNPRSAKDHARSIAFEQLAPLLTVPGIQFVSLQKDVRPSDASALRACGEVIDLCADLQDFLDTAAIISQLDLVISVDTAVAHLAGALGKPVWVLLPPLPDFRWLLDRKTSPWYPSARLFRKSRARDWNEVISSVRIELIRTGLQRS